MKKTNKPNPLKFFNDNKAMAYKKAGGEMDAYKKSLKKAQDGTEMDNDIMINKPGYGAKTTRNPLAPYAGIMNPTSTMQDLAKAQMENVNAVNAANTSNALSARSAAIQGKAARGVADMMSTVRKRGGAVKTKKRK